MTRLSTTQKSAFDKNFGPQWIFFNALAHGIGLSLAIWGAELVASLGWAQNYLSSMVIAYGTFGIWVGFTQWLLLRQVMPVSGQWFLYASVAPALSLILPYALTPLSPFAIFLLIITYPLGLSVSQWMLWRRMIQPSWDWMVTSFVAIELSLLISVPVGILSYLYFRPPLSVAVLVGGLSYGAVYGLVTYIGLRRLTKQRNVVSSPQSASRMDVPPDTPSWQVQMLPGLMFMAMWGLWILIVLPKPSARVMEQLNNIPFTNGIIYIFAVFLGYLYLSILIHELGHLLFALTQSYTLKVCAVDRWGLVRWGKKWEFFKMRKSFAGGFVLPIPKSLKVLNNRSLMIMFWGGPIASFILFAVSALPLLFPSLINSHLAFWVIALLAGINLYMALFNLLPLTLGYLKTDGRRILDLIQNNSQGQRALSIYGCYASLRQGIRPRDINLTFIEKLLAIPDKSAEHVFGLLVAYTIALDKREIELAGHYLDEALELHLHLPELFRGELLLEGAYFESHIRHRKEIARQWFDKIEERALIEPAALFRAEAALHLAEGNQEAAKTSVAQGLERVKRDRFMQGNAVMEEDQLHEIALAIG